MSSRWNHASPPSAAWRVRKGLTRAGATAEQDKAAGGRESRLVALARGGTARASVYLRLFEGTRRVRAYLRWSEGGGTRERYLGEVRHPTRAANLRDAWEVARAMGLIAPPVPPAVVSWASSPAVRSVMRGNRGRDTKPEMRLRSALHAQGLRYRVDVRPIPGLRRTADVVFPAARVAVFVDGCYWHGCPDHLRPAKTNAEFWTSKIEGTVRRDAETDRLLIESGWRVLRIWEHEAVEEATRRVADTVRASAAAVAPSAHSIGPSSSPPDVVCPRP